MKLYISKTSPYSRKTRVLVEEHALGERVQKIIVNPFDDPQELIVHSVVAKVPVLVVDEIAIFDSRVICEYLDCLGEKPLMPVERWADQTRTAVGDALMDAALAVVLETKRNATEQSPGWIARQTERAQRIANACLPGTAGHLTLGDVAVASGLAYLDFRLPNIDWRATNPALAVWHAVIERRPSFTNSPLG